METPAVNRVAKEGLMPAVSPLGDVVRETRDDDTSQSDHITEEKQNGLSITKYGVLASG